ncbi:hypothetical protein ACW9HH_36035 [Nocardia gipuzkoensis]
MRYLIQLDDLDRGDAPHKPYTAALYEQRDAGQTGDAIEVEFGNTPADALRALATEMERRR